MFVIVLGQHVSILIECFLEGPEDDSIRIENCCSKHNKVVLCLKHHCIFIYVLNTSGWQT